MAARIIPKKSIVEGKVPLTGDLLNGEMAANLADAKFYVKHPDGTIINMSGAAEIHGHDISDTTGLQAELDSKVDDSEFNNSNIKTMYENNLDTNAYTDAEKTKLSGIEAGAEVNVKPDWTASTGDSEILNKPVLGTASAEDVEYFATAAQGSNADIAYSWGDHGAAGYEYASNKGAADGYASLDSAGKIPNSQLPSFVDDILEYADQSSFPTTGESGKLYVAIDTGRVYRWGGSQYTEIKSGEVDSVNSKVGNVVLDTDDVNEGTTNLYFTEQRARNAISASGDLIYSNGVISFNETYSSAADLRSALKSVDGAGSGLDADVLDGQHGSFYQNAGNLNAGVIPSARIPDASNTEMVNGINGRFADASAVQYLFGYYGFGTSEPEQELTTIAEVDAAIEGGMYQITNILEMPSVASYGHMFVMANSSSRVTQIFSAIVGTTGIPELHVRIKRDSGWSGWNKIALNGDDVEFLSASFNGDVAIDPVGHALTFDTDATTRDLIRISSSGTSAWKLYLDDDGDLRFFSDVGGKDVTIDGNKVWHAGNDGSGTGLDSDTVDGLEATQFLRSDQVNQITGTGELMGFGDADLNNADAWIRFGNSSYDWLMKYQGTTSGDGGNEYQLLSSITGYGYQIDHDANFNVIDATGTHAIWHEGNMPDYRSYGLGTVIESPYATRVDANAAGDVNQMAWNNTADPDSAISGTSHAIWSVALNSNYASQLASRSGDLLVRGKDSGVWGGWNTVWTSANDGSGSGLDADKLDGLDSTQFLRNDTDVAMNGNINFPYQNQRGLYFNGIGGASHAYIRQPTVGQLDIGSDNAVKFYETDDNILCVDWSLNDRSYNFIGTLRQNGTEVWTQDNADTQLALYPTLDLQEIHLGGATDDGINSLQVNGGTRTDSLGIGTSTTNETLEVAGTARMQDENAMKYGGNSAGDAKYAIQYNSSTNSLDFNYIGS